MYEGELVLHLITTDNFLKQKSQLDISVVCKGIECFKVTVTGLREYFSQTDERAAAPRMPLMVNMTSVSNSSKRNKKFQSTSFRFLNSSNKNASMMDEYSDDDDDFQCADEEVGLYFSYAILMAFMIEFYHLHICRFLCLRLKTKELVRSKFNDFHAFIFYIEE